MATIKARNIPESVLKNNECEDYEEFVFLLGEARAVNALAFFDIDYDETRDTVEYSDEFNFTDALNIVKRYLALVDEENEEIRFDKSDLIIPHNCEDIDEYLIKITTEAKRYDSYTKDARGADDGTYDYAGTFVISILNLLQEVKNLS